MSKFLIAKSKEEEYWALVDSVDEAKTRAKEWGWKQLWMDDASPTVPSDYVPDTDSFIEQVEANADGVLYAEDEIFDYNGGKSGDAELQQFLKSWADKHLSSMQYSGAGNPRRIEDYKGHFKK